MVGSAHPTMFDCDIPRFLHGICRFDGCVGDTMKHTAFDGKQLHCSFGTHNNISAIHRVSAEKQPVPLFLDTTRRTCYNKSSSAAVSGTLHTDFFGYTVLFLF